MRRRAAIMLICLAVAANCRQALAGAARLPFAVERLELPGAPQQLLSVDLDADGDRDLAAVIDYSQWTTQSVSERHGFEESVEVLPLLEDRRELWLFLQQGDGRWKRLETPLTLARRVLALSLGPHAAPLVALTDTGVEAVRLTTVAERLALTLVPWVAIKPVIAGSGALLTDLPFCVDIDGDGERDLAIPTDAGISLQRVDPKTGEVSAATVVRLPEDRPRAGVAPERNYPLPRLDDLTGDGRPDLVIAPGARVSAGLGIGSVASEIPGRMAFLPGLGAGQFGPPVHVPLDCVRQQTGDLIYVGDIDGDGTAELLTQQMHEGDDEKLKDVGMTRSRISHHHLAADGRIEPKPYATSDVVGFPLWVKRDGVTLNAFVDLDGDRRKELVTITFTLSVSRALFAVMTKRITLPLSFHVYRLDATGRYQAVVNEGLEDKLKIDFGDMRLDRFAQFAGDFDGDGRIDFLHVSTGRTLTVHAGKPGCVYDPKPNLTIALSEGLEGLADLRVDDYDGDGRADLAIIRPREVKGAVDEHPIYLDLHRSRGAESAVKR